MRGSLALADGTIFRGESVGVEGLATGEVVFNTSMTGYLEIATDPSYARQIVVMTAPHIGNYGTSLFDEQANKAYCAGFVVRSMSRRASNWRSEGLMSDWLTEKGVVALSDIDTRRLTRRIRHHGAMPAAVGSGVDDDELLRAAQSTPPMEGLNLIKQVTTSYAYVQEVRDPRARIVAYDFGIKQDILRQLTRCQLEVHVVPANTSAAEVLSIDPSGVFLSNGPGDPAALTEIVAAIRGLLGKTPIFGICLGQQVLGLALGATTRKLPFGHHGGNHPVRHLADGKVDITSHNHGFTVDLWSLTDRRRPPANPSGLPTLDMLPESVESDFGVVVPTHQNLNDGTLEGLECRDIDAFSVQYHPEAAPGPNDASVLFDRFAAVVG